jgi:thiamine biosynthesis lipoprotein
MIRAAEHERGLELFGTSVRILAGPPASPGAPRAELAAVAAEAMLRRHQRALSRFEPASELSLLNGDPGAARRVSELTARAVAGALWVAERSRGLVDPTLLPELELAGYARSRTGAEPASLHDALSAAPARRPATPRAGARWREVSLEGCTVRRPPGLRLDLGGTAKGLAADRAALLLAGQATFAVDAGGDIVFGGMAGAPRRVAVAHPLEPATAFSVDLSAGAVATSGLGTRLWRTEAGFAHHLLDPSTGRPAWTGVAQATALADSGVEAESLAKMALLSGPEAGRALLEDGGGVLVLDDGEVVVAGELRSRAELAA